MSQTAKDIAAYGMHLAPPIIRCVWAAVTARPQATARELAAELDIGYSTVASALRMLRAAGYVDFASGTTGRTIVVPFVVQPITIHRRLN